MGGLERDSMPQARQALPAAGLLGPATQIALAQGQVFRGNECLRSSGETPVGESWQALTCHKRWGMEEVGAASLSQRCQ